MPTLLKTTTHARAMAQSLYYASLTSRGSAHLSAGRLLEERARGCPHQSAIIFENRHYSYRSFNAASNRISSTLASLGARPGDTVALLMDNRPEYLFALVGCNKLGIVTSLLNTQLREGALSLAIVRSDARWLIVGEEHLPKLRAILDTLPLESRHILVWSEGRAPRLPAGVQDLNRLVRTASDQNPRATLDVRADDPMLHLHPPYEAGGARCATIRNRRFLRASFILGKAVLRLAPRDVMYIALPLHHAKGSVTGWGAVLAAGGCVALRRRFSAEAFWEDCQRYGATVFPYTRELCQALMDLPPDDLEREHDLRVIAGTGMSLDLWKPFQRRFAIPQVIEFYGFTEGNVALVNLDGEPGMLGQLQPEHKVVRVDPHSGQLTRDARGHLVQVRAGEQGVLLGRIDRFHPLDGYLEPVSAEGDVVVNPFNDGHDYFNTGDLVQLHEGGFVSFASSPQVRDAKLRATASL